MTDTPDNWVKATFDADPANFVRPEQAEGGMSAVTPDGAGNSSQGAAPESSQSSPLADDGGGGMTGNANGAGMSVQGMAPEGSTAPPTPADSDGTAGSVDAGIPVQGTDTDGSVAPATPAESGGATGSVNTGVAVDGSAPDGSPAPVLPDDGGAGTTGSAGGGNLSAPGAAPISLPGGGDKPTGPANGDKRKLTSDEQSYAHAIFQDTLDYGAIEINYNGIGSTGSTRTIGDTIEMTADEFKPGTFDLTPKGRETLIHEMTHVWQYQHEGAGYAPAALWAQFVAWLETGTRNAAYDWVALYGAGTPWKDWNPEAQAEAVERYNQALRAIQAGKGTPDDFKDFGILQKYITEMLAGPPKKPDSGEGAGGGSGASGGDQADAGTPGADDEE